MPEVIGKVEAIKKYFGAVKPVENKEILELRKSMRDPKEWDEFAGACAKALGCELSAS